MILVQVILQLAVAVERPLGSSYRAQEALDNVLDQFSRTRIAIDRDLPRDKKGLRHQFVCLNGLCMSSSLEANATDGSPSQSSVHTVVKERGRIRTDARVPKFLRPKQSTR